MSSRVPTKLWSLISMDKTTVSCNWTPIHSLEIMSDISMGSMIYSQVTRGDLHFSTHNQATHHYCYSTDLTVCPSVFFFSVWMLLLGLYSANNWGWERMKRIIPWITLVLPLFPSCRHEYTPFSFCSLYLFPLDVCPKQTSFWDCIETHSFSHRVALQPVPREYHFDVSLFDKQPLYEHYQKYGSSILADLLDASLHSLSEIFDYQIFSWTTVHLLSYWLLTSLFWLSWWFGSWLQSVNWYVSSSSCDGSSRTTAKTLPDCIPSSILNPQRRTIKTVILWIILWAYYSPF